MSVSDGNVTHFRSCVTGKYSDRACYSLLKGDDSNGEPEGGWRVDGEGQFFNKAERNSSLLYRRLMENGRIGYSRGWRGERLLFVLQKIDETRSDMLCVLQVLMGLWYGIHS